MQQSLRETSRQAMNLKVMAILSFVIVLTFHLLMACSGNSNDSITVVFDPQTTYTLKMTGIEHLISDSGVTKVRIITKTQLKFDKASDPYWLFPDGFYAETFDSLMNVEAIIKADTVYYHEKRKIWEAVGNVDVTNFDSTRFQSHQLFWDQNKKIIYSDTFVTVTGKDFVRFGSRFVANQELTEYEFFNSSGEFLIELNRRRNPVDSIPSVP
jgi:LPS export ABC transporter protein LptC